MTDMDETELYLITVNMHQASGLSLSAFRVLMLETFKCDPQIIRPLIDKIARESD